MCRERFYRLDKEAKRAQLKADGRYPWKFAVAHIRYGQDPPLTEEQAYKVLWTISGSTPEFFKQAERIADLRIDQIIANMVWHNIRHVLQAGNQRQGPP